ncbi:hypothetical protein ADIWIN_0383 [Winogradskyella psychrotolerans RS-3]|uniref:Uncharacterized protein n=2 Tax=Winogradskyella TaxID=286104 RepID=S7VWZ3_9FLAO|nr:hypothetical protein ADIWIN_0383 [Winogradskyella psychrotolerans RS-3]
MNFGSVLVLSTVLNETVFSEFVVLYSYSTLINIILTTVFSAPILVFGIKKWDSEKYNYLSVNIICFTIFNIVFSIISFFFLRIQVTQIFLLNFLLMNFGLTLVEIFKRFIFSNKVISTGFAPVSSLLMNIVFFSGIYVYKDALSLNLILVVYWVAYLLASLFFVIIIYYKTDIKKELSVLSIFNKDFYTSVFFTHFKYAKWILAGAVSFWVYTQGIYIFWQSFWRI